MSTIILQIVSLILDSPSRTGRRPSQSDDKPPAIGKRLIGLISLTVTAPANFRLGKQHAVPYCQSTALRGHGIILGKRHPWPDPAESRTRGWADE
jgi:hypothetical protein